MKKALAIAIVLSIATYAAPSTSSFYPLKRANPKLLVVHPMIFVSLQLARLLFLCRVPSYAYPGSRGFLLATSRPLPGLPLCSLDRLLQSKIPVDPRHRYQDHQSNSALVLLSSMSFHEVTFCGHAHPKISFVRQNVVAEHAAFFDDFRGQQVESFCP
jgi:hypothetical protein